MTSVWTPYFEGTGAISLSENCAAARGGRAVFAGIILGYSCALELATVKALVALTPFSFTTETA